MAHEIDMSTGNAAVFCAGEAPWHKLGTVVEKCQTSADAIKLAHLDWEVTKEPTYTNVRGKFEVIPNSFATVRSDTKAVLGVVGSAYRPFQNAEAFDFMDSLVGDKLAMFETAGALKGGRVIWMMARVPGEYRIAKDDIVKPYTLLTAGHDGVKAIRMLPTTVRVVCQNTLNLALRETGAAEGISIMHNEVAERRLAEAREKFGLIAKRLSAFELQAQAMARKTMTQKQIAEFYGKLVEGRSEKSQKTQIERWFENLQNERNNLKGIRGSAWAVFNSVSEYADHNNIGAGKTPMEKTDNRLSSIWFGGAARIKTQAFDAAFALVS